MTPWWMTPEVVVPVSVFCLAASAFFSGTETGLLSVSRIRLRGAARDGDARRVGLLRRMLGRVEDPVLSCLIGTNLFNVLFGAFVTAVLTTRYGARGDVIAAVVVSALVIVFGEILPKVLYREFAERMTLASVRPLRGVMIVLAPLRAVLLGYSALLERVLPGRARRDGEGPGREGMASLLRAHGGGGGRMFDELLGRCLQLADLNLGSLTTHMGRVVSLPLDASLSACRDAAAVSGYSRLPVHDGDASRPVGWILARDLLFRDDDDPWDGIPADLVRTCPYVDQGMSPWALFEEMRWQRQQMAIVTDSDGTPVGLVTLEDLLEMLVGSIEDEFDRGWRRAAP